ncbi:MAG: inositol oxygenase family protein [Bryobacteraceae bacterium]
MDLHFNRRKLIAALVAAGGAGVTGAALAYRHRYDVWAGLRMNKNGLKEFLQECDRIHERHRAQTAEMVKALKRKYEDPVFGRIRVWDLVERMQRVHDTSDPGLMGMSQFGHVIQVLDAMESSRVQNPSLLLLALLHDAGKTIVLAGEAPENVFCPVRRLGEYPQKCGLDQVVYQFGHAEFIYSRIKDHVPPEVSWAARYHTVNLADATPFMTDAELRTKDDLLRPFRRFDGGFKSPYRQPMINQDKYRDLIEQMFPTPILI